MTTTLACKSNEAALNLGGTSCTPQSVSVQAKSCMEVLVPGEGTIFSTCTLCEGEGKLQTHTEHLGGKWSYCAGSVGDAKQGMKTADFLPFHSHILAFL